MMQSRPKKSREAFGNFYRDLFYLNPNEYLSSGRRYLLGGAVPVEVVCLNSSLIEQKKGWFQGHGFVGKAQLDDAAKQMGWIPPAQHLARPFRIVVLHHHLLPVTYREEPYGGYPYSVALDAEAVMQWVVEHRVDLVLHGHMHKEFCARVSRPIDGKPGDGAKWHTFHILGMGSSGVAKDHRENSNIAGFLRFERDHVKVQLVTIEPVGPSSPVWEIKVPLRSKSHETPDN